MFKIYICLSVSPTMMMFSPTTTAAWKLLFWLRYFGLNTWKCQYKMALPDFSPVFPGLLGPNMLPNKYSGLSLLTTNFPWPNMPQQTISAAQFAAKNRHMNGIAIVTTQTSRYGSPPNLFVLVSTRYKTSRFLLRRTRQGSRWLQRGSAYISLEKEV